MKKLWLALGLVCVILSGCSSENPNPKFGSGKLAQALKSLAAKKSASGVEGNPFAQVTQADLEQLSGPLFAVFLEDSKAFSTLSFLARNRDVTTLVSPDRVNFNLRQGIVISTRGLPGDIMSSDVDGLYVALKNRKDATYSRGYNWLNGEDHIDSEVVSCELIFIDTAEVIIAEKSNDALHYRESCTNQTINIVNDYWIDVQSEVIWQSRQWLGRNLGYVSLTVLLP